MKFGEVPIADAEGAILAHSVRLPDGAIRKGCVLDGDDLDRLGRAGIERVMVARLEADDLDENEAASGIATAMAAPGLAATNPHTGRSRR